MSIAPRHFAWYELMTPDPVAATAFYDAVVGWQSRDAGMTGMAYTLLAAGGVDVAGVMELPREAVQQGIPPCWTGYIGVPDVDAHVVKLTSAGGSVHRGAENIPGVGRFAVVGDLQGAVFILFTPAGGMTRPAVAPYTPGHVGWHELHAGERVSAFAFYSALFGWTEIDAMDMGPMGVYQTFGDGEVAFGGMMTKPEGAPAPCWRYYFTVESVNAAILRATAGGGQVVFGPVEVPGGGFVANCIDPQGAAFSLVGPA